MIIIYYKNRETGQYENVHLPRPGQTMTDLALVIERYNDMQYRTTCGAVEVADDGLEAYLFSTRNLRANVDKAALRDAIESLESALADVRFLED